MVDQAQLLRDYIKKRQKNRENAPEAKRHSTKILSVTSGKGGVGKSNFTVNFALKLAEAGKKILIIDADFGLSNVDVLLGITPKYDLSHVLRKERALSEVICQGPNGIGFISGGSGVYDLLVMGNNDIDYVLEELENIEDEMDYIIFDTGAGINENNIRLIGSSNEVLLITTPEPPAVVDAYAVAKMLHRENSGAKLRLVINRAESKDEATKISDNFINVSRNYLKLDIEALGYVADDSAVVKAVKSQKPFVISYPSSKAAKNMVNISRRYMELPETEGSGLRSFINRMLGR